MPTRRRRLRSARLPETWTKEPISIRLDRTALAAWRATGKGWQTRLADCIARLKPQSEGQ